MTNVMKAIVLHQPWATLIALGVKTIETRSSPPNGPMRPDGVRGFPGLPIEPGERIAIVAGTKPVKKKAKIGRHEVWPADHPDRPHPNHPDGRPDRLYDNDNEGRRLLSIGSWRPLPLGRVVATVRVTEALPMVAETGEYDDELYQTIGQDTLYRQTVVGDPAIASNVRCTHFHDQVPYGDYAPGRWGWMLADVEQVDWPVEVVRGSRQGVFEIGDKS